MVIQLFVFIARDSIKINNNIFKYPITSCMRAHGVYNRADGFVIFVYLYSYPSTRVVNVTYNTYYL